LELWVFLEPFKDTRFILLTIASFMFFMGMCKFLSSFELHVSHILTHV
jgi:hypothetical protein